MKKGIFTLFHYSEEQLHFQMLITLILKTIHEARDSEQSYSCYVCMGEAKVVLSPCECEVAFSS